MKPDWKDAPEWATMLMRNNLNNGTYCWTDGKEAITLDGYPFNFTRFESCYHIVELCPFARIEPTTDKYQGTLPKVGDKLLYSLGMDIWYECEIKYVVPNYGVVALCQPIGGECEQWLNTTTKFKPLPLTEEEKYEELLRDVSQHCSWCDIASHLYKLGYHK